MSTHAGPDKEPEEWLDRFTGIKAESYFVAGVGTKRHVLWNELEAGDGTTEWIKLDHSALVRVRR